MARKLQSGQGKIRFLITGWKPCFQKTTGLTRIPGYFAASGNAAESSAGKGNVWKIHFRPDEIGPSWKGVIPDAFDADHDTIRAECLWGTLLAGDAGAEWYFGYRYPNNDLNTEDFRSRDNWWKQSTLATHFIKQFPVEEMDNHDELVQAPRAWCLAKPGKIYVIYLRNAGEKTTLQLDDNHSYSVRWFNPRALEKMQNGSISTVTGKGRKTIGYPPSDLGKDWVAVVQRIP